MNAFHGWEELRSKWGRKMVGVIRYESIEARGDGQAAGSPMGLIHFVSKYALNNHHDAFDIGSRPPDYWLQSSSGAGLEV